MMRNQVTMSGRTGQVTKSCQAGPIIWFLAVSCDVVAPKHTEYFHTSSQAGRLIKVDSALSSGRLDF